MDLSLIFNDPAHQQIASMMGMDMQAYVANMDPRAVQANIANLSRGPAVYNTQEQVDNLNSVGANSGANAYTPEQGSPVTAGALSTPTQPTQPNVGSGVLNTASANRPVQTGATPAALSQPGQGGMLPEHGGGISEPFVPQYPGDVPDHVRNAQNSAPPTANPHPDAVLTSGGTAATPGALTSGGNSPAATPAAAAPRPNAGPSSGARQTPTNNTGNARRSGMPDMRIGRMEQLGRIGTAMVGASQNGLLASMAAGGNAMYAGADQNRAVELAEYSEAERLRAEEQKRRDKIAARNAKGKAKGGTGELAGGGIYQQATLDAIEAIEGYLDTDDESMNPFLSINGWTGNFLSTKPGVPAHDVAGLLKTVVASIGFDRLDAMRKASKTGGALGSITEGELRLLQSSLGSLQQSSTAPEFRRNLNSVKKHYQSVLASMENDRIADGDLSAAPSQPTGSAPAPTNSTTTDFSAADALVFGG